VTLIPAADRPFIGSTSDNSILSLIFGYNGLSRLFGESGGAGPGGGGGFGGGGAGPGGGNIGFGGAVGWLRMFNPANGSQISWLIPLAVAGLLAGLWVSRRAPRTDRYRAGWLLWGVWALVSLVLFSRAEGIFHPYYTVQAAPAVAALAGAGSIALWRLGRTNRWLQWVLPVAILVSATWAVVLLNQTPAYNPWLRPAIIVGATLAVVGLWLGSQLRQRSIVVGAAAVAVVTLLAGPLAFALTTINAPAGGAIVFAGPAVADAGPGGAGGFGRGAGADGGTGDDGGGGFGRGATANSGLVTYLEANQGDATYLVAAFGSQSSAPLIIATGRPVITIGGFNGGDPAPTLAQFQQLVSSGQVRFLLVSGGGGGGGFGGGPGGGGTGQSISTWAAQNGTAVPATAYGGASAGTLYDLSGAA
jgi:4-amino-4-deoxy-L-arabinose transferase-like glycosyltransferase